MLRDVSKWSIMKCVFGGSGTTVCFSPWWWFWPFPSPHLSITSPFLATLRKHIISALIEWRELEWFHPELCWYLKALCNSRHLFFYTVLLKWQRCSIQLYEIRKGNFSGFLVALENTPFFNLACRLSAVVYNIFSFMLLALNPSQLPECAAQWMHCEI